MKQTKQIPKIGDKVMVTDGSSDGHTGHITAILISNYGTIRIKRDSDGVEVDVSNYYILDPSQRQHSNAKQMFKPDFVKIMSAPESEAELTGFSFIGPGWYHHAEDTLLVIPTDRPASSFWYQKFGVGELFEFNFYNNRNPAEVFNLILNAPEHRRTSLL